MISRIEDYQADKDKKNYSRRSSKEEPTHVLTIAVWECCPCSPIYTWTESE